MRRLVTQTNDKRLVLSRNRTAYLSPVAGMAALTALALRLCFLHPPAARTAQAVTNLHQFAAAVLVPCACCLVVGLPRLRAQKWAFDRVTGRILLNGAFVCRIEDVSSVHLDRRYCAGTSPSSDAVLYLRTWAGVNIGLDREGVFGVGKPELQEKAEAVCGFLGVALERVRHF